MRANGLLVGHYFILGFLVSLGVIQLAAARSSLAGLSLVRDRRAAGALGGVLIGAGLLVYLVMPLWIDGPWATADSPTSPPVWGTIEPEDVTAAHNVSDTDGGLSGNAQAIVLMGACATALVVAGLSGALTVRRSGRYRGDGGAVGLAALEEGNLVAAIRSTWPSSDGESGTRSGRSSRREHGSPT